MTIRYPPPLTAGSRIGITAPSAGVADRHRPRLDFCVAWLRGRGYEVVVGECMDGAGVTSAPPRERAAELTAMLTDPQIAAVVPPWGGELAVEILPHLDFDAIAAATPTWLVGYSDTSTILTPLTLRTGVATIHGHNLMDTPYRLPPEVIPWCELAAGAHAGATISQSPPPVLRSAHAGADRWENGPMIAASTEYTLDEPTRGWSLLSGGEHAPELDVSGRLIGGCLEVLAPLAGSPYGDLSRLTATGDGVIVYLEASGNDGLDIARCLWTFRLTGWLDPAHTRAVLIGRTHAPDSPGFSQRDAVVSAIGDLPIPVVLDVDCGHVVPQLALVNGALARVQITADRQRIEQSFV